MSIATSLNHIKDSKRQMIALPRPLQFGFGMRITHGALAFAHGDPRTASVAFLLPPTQTKLGALSRMGAVSEGEVTQDGALFAATAL